MYYLEFCMSVIIFRLSHITIFSKTGCHTEAKGSKLSRFVQNVNKPDQSNPLKTLRSATTGIDEVIRSPY